MHFYPYRVSPMSDATVADELAFSGWTDEQKRIARVVLGAEIREEIEEAQTEYRDFELEEAKGEADGLRRAIEFELSSQNNATPLSERIQSILDA